MLSIHLTKCHKSEKMKKMKTFQMTINNSKILEYFVRYAYQLRHATITFTKTGLTLRK